MLYWLKIENNTYEPIVSTCFGDGAQPLPFAPKEPSKHASITNEDPVSSSQTNPFGFKARSEAIANHKV
jgi:hypothetical protein